MCSFQYVRARKLTGLSGLFYGASKNFISIIIHFMQHTFRVLNTEQNNKCNNI